MSLAAVMGLSVLSSVAVAAAPKANPASERLTGVEFILGRSARDLTWDVGGGRQTYNQNAITMERVWGWSTCNSADGAEVYHYTTARYKDFLGLSRPEWTGKSYGYGKVYAYSPGVGYWDVAGSLHARVYYGL